jgi:hypothetical protein
MNPKAEVDVMSQRITPSILKLQLLWDMDAILLGG